MPKILTNITKDRKKKTALSSFNTSVRDGWLTFWNWIQRKPVNQHIVLRKFETDPYYTMANARKDLEEGAGMGLIPFIGGMGGGVIMVVGSVIPGVNLVTAGIAVGVFSFVGAMSYIATISGSDSEETILGDRYMRTIKQKSDERRSKANRNARDKLRKLGLD